MKTTVIKTHLALFALSALLLFPVNVFGAPQCLDNETQFFLPSKAFFSVLKGWFVEQKDKGFKILDPDQRLTMVITDSSEDYDSDAINGAWKEFFPDFSLSSKVVPVEEKVKIWDHVSHARYYFPMRMGMPKEYINQYVSAYAFEYRNKWYVYLIKGPQAVVDARYWELNYIFRSLRPSGFIEKKSPR